MLEDTTPVLWSQGLFLQPQHFQHSDLAADAGLRSLRRNHAPWPWGYYDLALSPGAVQNSQIEVTRLHAVFPDGCEVALPGNATIPPRSFAGAWTQPERPFMVYLALRRHDPNAKNVHSHEEEETFSRGGDSAPVTRFLSSYSPQKYADLHGDGPAEGVRTLRYSLRVCWEAELEGLADCDFLPLARLVRIGDGITQDATYVPPALKMGAFPNLATVLREIRDQLLGRSANLEEYKPAEGKAEIWQSDPKAFTMILALMIINRNIPACDFAAESDALPPWNVHLHLRRLAAELSSLTTGINALGNTDAGEQLLPPYRHDDPLPCFNAARNLISNMLSRVAAGPEHLIRMEKEGGVLLARPSESFFEPGLRHYLLLRGDLKVEEIRLDAARYGKLCPLANLRYLVVQALPGIELLNLEHPPIGLPRRLDTAYFEINALSPLWRDIIRGTDRTIAFAWDTGGREIIAHLAALRKA